MQCSPLTLAVATSSDPVEVVHGLREAFVEDAGVRSFVSFISPVPVEAGSLGLAAGRTVLPAGDGRHSLGVHRCGEQSHRHGTHRVGSWVKAQPYRILSLSYRHTSCPQKLLGLAQTVRLAPVHPLK